MRTIEIAEGLKEQFKEEKQLLLSDHADEMQQLLRRKEQ